MPKVSILVPVYNVEKYLNECLDSLIRQSLEDIEIICINDGSTDHSAEILEEYSLKDSRIRIIHKENSGYGISMNMGLEAAKGEYIGIVESDDFADLNMFNDLYSIASKNNADIVKSDFYYYFTENKLARRAGKIAKNKCAKVFSIKDDSSVLKIMPTIWSAIYKKEFLLNNDIKFLETPGASYQDTSFAFKALASAERIVFTSNSYLYYRSDNEASSVKNRGKIYAICNEYKEITNFLDKNPDIKKIANSTKLLNQFQTYKWNAMRIDEKFRDEFIEQFQREFQDFYNKREIPEKINKKELKMLLENKKAFRKYLDKSALKQEAKTKRQKQFSIRINPSRISVILFGKAIAEIQF